MINLSDSDSVVEMVNGIAALQLEGIKMGRSQMENKYKPLLEAAKLFCRVDGGGWVIPTLAEVEIIKKAIAYAESPL